MEVAVIGCRNHAARLIGLLAANPEISSLLIYHPSNPRIPPNAARVEVHVTTNLKDLAGVPLAVIASPNETHLFYIQALLPLVKRIFCEKPPATNTKEINELESLSLTERARVNFNFHYQYTAMVSHLCKSELGGLVSAEFTSTHGIAFSSDFTKSWRAKGDGRFNRIFGNVGIHYIHMLAGLFGPIQSISDLSEFSAVGNGVIDSTVFQVGLPLNRKAHVTLSYAAPFTNTARVIFTNGVVELECGVIRQYTPRDVFDKQGRFTRSSPETIYKASDTKSYYDAALSASLADAIKVAKSEATFSHENFDNALTATKIVLEAG